MKRTVFGILFLFSLMFSVHGQRSESEIALREYFTDAEFFLAQNFYLDALSDFQQVYKRGYQDNPNINYRIGICYLNIPGQKEKAIPFLKKAVPAVSNAYRESTLNEKHAPLDVYLYLGNAYRVTNQLDKAIEAYMKYKEILPEDEENLHYYTDKQIEACNIANEFMASPVNVEFMNLGDVINSSADDYKAVISGDGSTLVYMHKLPFYDAVYYSKNKGEGWSAPINVNPEILSDGDQFVCDLSYDGKTMLLTKEDEFNSDIMISTYNDEENRWNVSVPMGSNINTKYWESHASLSKDGNTIFFASNRRNGQGAMDLYYATRREDGTFGEAVNMVELNTELNEDTPFVTADGKLLFFSSQGFINMGGYDVFVSRKEGDSWGLPVNLGYPINSTDDDLFYYPLNNGKAGLMSLILDDGFGGTDINEVEFIELPQALVEVKEEPVQVAVEERTAEEVVDEVAGNVVEEVIAEQQEEPEIGENEEPEESVTVEIQEVETEPAQTEEMETPSIKEEIQKIELSPILFGFDKSSLTAEGKAELDRVAELMKANKPVSVVLTGFADPLGPESYNLILSKKRAQTALSYLLSKGVDANRVKAVGKGETNFIAKNTDAQGKDLPKGRMYNRRVEFEIKGVDASKISILRVDPVPDDLKIEGY